MFIETSGSIKGSSLQRSDMYGLALIYPVHCAPLERQTLVGR
jgi:hypothetical protein